MNLFNFQNPFSICGGGLLSNKPEKFKDCQSYPVNKYEYNRGLGLKIIIYGTTSY